MKQLEPCPRKFYIELDYPVTKPVMKVYVGNNEALKGKQALVAVSQSGSTVAQFNDVPNLMNGWHRFGPFSFEDISVDGDSE